MRYPDQQHITPVEEPDLSGTYTAADYLRWQFEGLVELIRGKLFRMSPAPTSDHQVVSSNLLRHLFRVFDGNGCAVFHAPFDVYLVHPGEDFRKTKNIVQPDLCIICDKAKIKKQGCIGSPDLVIEILSPSNLRKDVSDKFSLYEEYGVREYWIVHPQDGTVLLHVLKDGRYEPQRLRAKGEILQSVIFPDLSIDLESVFPQTEAEDLP